MVETLVLDDSKPYHQLFPAMTVQAPGSGWPSMRPATYIVRQEPGSIRLAVREKFLAELADP